jgi:hypothetical protein
MEDILDMSQLYPDDFDIMPREDYIGEEGRI